MGLLANLLREHPADPDPAPEHGDRRDVDVT